MTTSIISNAVGIEMRTQHLQIVYAHPKLSPQQNMTHPLVSLDANLDGAVPKYNSTTLIIKRAIDLVIASVALLTLLPFFLFVALAIKIDSRGPVLFRQIRWGKDCKKIGVYKFRSMHFAQCDITGVAQTTRNDPRITRVGEFLRRSNIDELPQLLNVIRGDMSLVGPRCHAIGMLAGGMTYEELVPSYHERHLVRPGITGLAQMRGLRGPTDRPSKARARISSDLYYVRHMSVALDLKIMVGTVLSELRGGKGF